MIKVKYSDAFRTEERTKDYPKIMSYVGTVHRQEYNAYLQNNQNAISGHLDFIFA